MATKLSEEARKLRNAYAREYYQRNKEKLRQRQTDFWERKAKTLKAQKENDK